MATPHESHKRSIAKAISWRIIATILALLVIYTFTGKLVLSLDITLVAAVVSTIAYYLHERAWSRVAWERK